MDVRGLITQQRRDLVALLRSLSEQEWDAIVVRGLACARCVGHLVGATIGLPAYLAIAVAAGSADRVNARLVNQAKAQSTSTLVGQLESSIGRGWAMTLLSSITLAGTLVGSPGHPTAIGTCAHRPG
jgi:anti-sigma factor RsiW